MTKNKEAITFLVLLFMVMVARDGFALELQSLDIGAAVANKHNEPVGTVSVARYRIDLNAGIELFAYKETSFGVDLNPSYFLSGNWPEQTEKWSAGEIQELEIEYKVFLDLKGPLRLWFEHYEIVVTKGWAKGYNARYHNLLGFTYKIK